MKKIEMITATCLGVSAIALSVCALVFSPLATEAHAGEVVSAGAFTFMTAEIQRDDEALFVLDSTNDQVLVYRAVARGRDANIELVGRVSIEDVLNQ